MSDDGAVAAEAEEEAENQTIGGILSLSQKDKGRNPVGGGGGRGGGSAPLLTAQTPTTVEVGGSGGGRSGDGGGGGVAEEVMDGQADFNDAEEESVSSGNESHTSKLIFFSGNALLAGPSGSS